MKRQSMINFLGIAGGLILTASMGLAQHTLRATLDGSDVVPPILTHGSGIFKATVSTDSISYELSYSQISAPVRVAFIYFGQPGVNGGFFVFLCGGGGKPACPPSGAVGGTITASDILPLVDQGINADDFPGVLGAIFKGLTYVKVHTVKFGTGEIRGQIRPEAPVK